MRDQRERWLSSHTKVALELRVHRRFTARRDATATHRAAHAHARTTASRGDATAGSQRDGSLIRSWYASAIAAHVSPHCIVL